MRHPILTFNNVYIDPFEPKLEEININDICHSLCYLSRANGHLNIFFSVAQHSINAMLEAGARRYSHRVQLACLMHDATECYMSDITRPVKLRLPMYKQAEYYLMKIILASVGIGDLSEDEWQKVGLVDDCMLELEFKELRGVSLGYSEESPVISHNLTERPFQEVRDEFMKYFLELQRKVCQNEGN